MSTCIRVANFSLTCRLTKVTLPAFPIINAKRLETSCLGLEGSGPVPYGLLTGILAHAAHLIPEIRPLHNKLWRSALLVLDDEYRLPRLSTLQCALLPLCSRPEEHGENAGQLAIAMSRVSRKYPLLDAKVPGSGSGAFVRAAYGSDKLDVTAVGDQSTETNMVGTILSRQMEVFTLRST